MLEWIRVVTWIEKWRSTPFPEALETAAPATGMRKNADRKADKSRHRTLRPVAVRRPRLPARSHPMVPV